MQPHGILLDLDDTLYEYEPTHKFSLKTVFDDIAIRNSLDTCVIADAFSLAKNRVKSILPDVASGHSRLLYFQLMFEELGLSPIPQAYSASELYWSTFLEKMSLSADAVRFLTSSSDVPICLVTDLTAEIQYRKLNKLGLCSYIQHIVTSEEVGVEKPHPYMFMHALNKLKCSGDEVIMIGDSLKKDIVGASLLGINSYWLNRSSVPGLALPKNSTEISSLDEVLL